MENVTMFNLIPIDGRKSFYGKAVVTADADGYTLYSYGTKVASIDNNGRFYRHWSGYSATTMRHVNAFVRTIGGMGNGGKDWWCSLSVTP